MRQNKINEVSQGELIEKKEQSNLRLNISTHEYHIALKKKVQVHSNERELNKISYTISDGDRHQMWTL